MCREDGLFKLVPPAKSGAETVGNPLPAIPGFSYLHADAAT